MKIDPMKWVEIARARSPSPKFMTDWFDGTTHPVRAGFYERHFTDSPNIGFASMQYWNGEKWLINKEGKEHWRQVGEYPSWRGLTRAQYKLSKAQYA